MNNAIHVEIQIVKLLIVRIRTSCIDGNNLSVNLSWVLFNDRSWQIETLAVVDIHMV
jgi:hypothetical protein